MDSKRILWVDLDLTKDWYYFSLKGKDATVNNIHKIHEFVTQEWSYHVVRWGGGTMGYIKVAVSKDDIGLLTLIFPTQDACPKKKSKRKL